MNEVVAHLATARLGDGRRVHPNDDVNRCQSSNDDIPTRAPAERRAGDRGGADPGARRAAGSAGGEGRGVLAGRQDRSDASPGRDADPARPGVRGLCRPGRGGDPARPGGTRRAADGAARRDRGRHRHQRPPGVRRAGLCPPDRAADACPSARRRTTSTPRRRSMSPIAAHGAIRTTALGLWKIASDIRLMGMGPRAGHRRAGAPRDAAGVVDHARQGEPGDHREPDDGRRPGRRQRRDRSRSARPGRSSSST